jgi:hypothetical protein
MLIYQRVTHSQNGGFLSHEGSSPVSIPVIHNDWIIPPILVSNYIEDKPRGKKRLITIGLSTINRILSNYHNYISTIINYVQNKYR